MKKIKCLLLLLALLSLPLASCMPPNGSEATKAPSQEASETTESSPTGEVTPTESAEASTEGTEVPTESAEPSTESTEDPTESTEDPTESAEDPTESAEASTESTEDPTDAPKSPYVFVKGEREVNQLHTLHFRIDFESKKLLLPCTLDYQRKHRISYEGVEEMDVTCCYKDRVHITPCDTHGDAVITYFIEYYGSYELTIPCTAPVKRELSFTCEGTDYVLPYYESQIVNGFVWDVYSDDEEHSVSLCRQSSAFRIKLGDGVILQRPADVSDWDALVSWATSILSDATGFSPKEYTFSANEQLLPLLDLTAPEVTGEQKISFFYRRYVGGVPTNETASVTVNTRGDIVAMNFAVHGADWSTVTPEIVQAYGNYGEDTTFTVTAQGIKVYYVYFPGNGREGISLMLEP